MLFKKYKICTITPIECQWLKNSSSTRPLIAFLKTWNDSMFANLSGRSFQSWTALYEKDLWPVADLKDGIWSLSLFLVFLVCTWLLVENLLHKDGGANPFIHLKAIKMSLTSSCASHNPCRKILNFLKPSNVLICCTTRAEQPYMRKIADLLLI